MSAELPNNADDSARIVMLTFGRMEDGKSTYWCYVAVRPSQYERFDGVLKAGQLNLHTFAEDGFGEVLVSGEGLYPPKEITREIAEAYKTPLRDLFRQGDPVSLISRKIKQLKQDSEA